ncbi:MAG: DUF2125 domain-containing protein, partial [Pseudomonadota bacterium]
MKKALIIGAAVLGLAAAGWSGLWFLGKGEIESRLEQETARMEGQGWKLLWGERSVSGFPFGYDVALSDVIATSERTGLLIRLGDILARADGSNPDRIITDLPPRIDITLPISEAQRIADPNLPRVVNIAVDSTGLALAAEGFDPTDRTFTVIADTLAVTVDQDDMAYGVDFQTEAMTATLVSGPVAQQVVFRAGRAMTKLANAADPVDPVLTYDYQDMSVTADIAARSLRHFTDQLAANEASLISGTSVVGSQTMTLSVAGQGAPGEAARSTMTYTAGASTALFGLDAGTLTYQGDDTLVNAVMETTSPSPALKEIKGSADVYQRRISLPLPFAGATPQEGALRISVSGINPDDTLWQALDAGGVLNRAPGLVEFDVLSTLSWVRDGAGGVPLQFSNVTIEQIAIDALGARARAKGDIEILQPIGLPQGKLDIDLKGIEAVL